MAYTKFANGLGFFLGPFAHQPSFILNASAHTAISAVGHSTTLIGRITLEGGTGSKTISSAGGKIYFVANGVTWAGGNTIMRVGIQDVAATGLEDGTFDVYRDATPGNTTIVANTVCTAAMTNGTKSITHGDLIAVSFELIGIGGGDSISLRRESGSQIAALPYVTSDSGAGPAKTATGSIMPIVIQFDDGTLGTFAPNFVTGGLNATTNFNTGSTPDEYALVFTPPFDFKASAIHAYTASLATTDDFEIIIYTDPLGTPAPALTISYDADIIGSSSGSLFTYPLASAFEFLNGVTYAVAFRPTTANSIGLQILNFNTGNAVLRKQTQLGESWALGTRSNQTGAFTQTTTQLPLIGLYVSDIHVTEGGGAVEQISTFG